MRDDDKRLTIKEAAFLLDRHERTVRRYIKRKILKRAVKLGTWEIPVEEVKRLKDEGY